MPVDFHQSTVVVFESRRASDMAALIERCRGTPISAPTMREVPLESHTEVFRFADRLFSQQIDIVLFLTGVGTRMLAQAVMTRYPSDRLKDALNRVVTVARGPKPVAALRQMDLKPSIVVPEPNTWEDLLVALDEQCVIQNKRIAIQEYGQSNCDLIEALKQRGADVLLVPVYRWQLPKDLALLRSAIDRIAGNEVDFALFTSATQIHHLFKVAEMDGKRESLSAGFKRICIGSIGPIASAAIVEHRLTVDYEPDSPHMSNLVRELARRGGDLLHKKRTAVGNGVDTNRWRRIEMIWSGAPAQPTIRDSVFLKACRRQSTPYTPIWIMRQAGRYQRAYRTIRAKISMLELCQSPQHASEITLLAVDQLGVDAAIIFADILLVVIPMGMSLEFVKGVGPVIDPPLRDRHDVDRLIKKPQVSDLGYVFEAIQLTRRALRSDIALIGFAGGPFTIASYMIEGGKSSQYLHTKTLMHNDPKTWDVLMAYLVEMLAEYMNAQIKAGANAVQIFDSWVGSLCPDDYERYVLPHVSKLIANVDHAVPLIQFATGNASLLPLMKAAGGDVIGLDWRVDLAQAWEEIGHDVAVMGNLDPTVLHASSSVIVNQARSILDKAAGRPGHIFNLGHGVLPTTPSHHVAELVDAVHELSARSTA